MFVYIEEAHPEGQPQRGPRRGRPPGGPGGRGVVKAPKTAAERVANARQSLDALKLSLTTVVDDMKDSTSEAYSAFPDRLFIVDRKGIIAYTGAPGPRGYDVAEMVAALDKLFEDGGVFKKPVDKK